MSLLVNESYDAWHSAQLPNLDCESSEDIEDRPINAMPTPDNEIGQTQGRHIRHGSDKKMSVDRLGRNARYDCQSNSLSWKTRFQAEIESITTNIIAKARQRDFGQSK